MVRPETALVLGGLGVDEVVGTELGPRHVSKLSLDRSCVLVGPLTGTLLLRNAGFPVVRQGEGPVVASGGRRVPLSGGSAGCWDDQSGWSAGVRQGLEPVDCPGDDVGPGPSGGEAEPATAAGVHESRGGGEQS